MELLFYFLLIPVLLAVVAYLAVTAYRRYKDRQLAALDDWSEHLSPAMIGKVEEASRSILDIVMPLEKCGFVPASGNYAGCTRNYGHEGPCAHDFAVNKPKLDVISMQTADKEFEAYQLEHLRTCYKHDGYYGPEYDRHDEAVAHNQAVERMHNYLLGKEVRSQVGGQAADWFAVNPIKKIPERKYKLPKPKYIQQNVHGLPMPVDEEMSAVTAGQAMEQITRYANASVDAKSDGPTPYTIIRALEAKEQEKKDDAESAEIHKLTGMLVTALTGVQAKLEDDAFHAKVVLEEKDKQIVDLKKQLEVEEILKDVEKRDEEYKLEVSSPHIIDCDGFKMWHVLDPKPKAKTKKNPKKKPVKRKLDVKRKK